VLDWVSYSSWHGLLWWLCLATWLAGSIQSKFEPAKALRSFWYAHLHAIFTFSNVGVITYYHSKRSCWKIQFRFYYFSHSDIIIPHLVLTPLSLSPSCRRPVPLQEGPRRIQHRGPRLWSPLQRQPPQRCQRQGPSRGSSLPTIQPSFPPLRTPSPTTAGFSPDFQFTWLARPKDGSGAGNALARPTRPPPLAPAPPPAARAAALGLRRQRVPLHRLRQMTRMLQTSSRGVQATIGRHCQPWTWRRCHPWVGWQLQDFSPLLSLAKLACAGWYTHIEIFHDFISETVWYAIWHRRWVGYDIIVNNRLNIMVNIMVNVMADIIDLWYHWYHRFRTMIS
jgi:hypothetical protein